MAQGALGLIETRGLVAALLATDAASKAAPVTVSGAERSGDAYVTVRLEGELAAVQAAVEAGAKAVRPSGHLIAAQVIPLPDRNTRLVWEHLATPDSGRSPASRHTPAAVATPAPAPDVTPAPAYAPDASHAPRLVAQRSASPKAKAPASAKSARVRTPATSPARPEPARAESQRAISPSDVPDWAALEAMAVPKLRQFARGVADLPIRGRQISMANKEQLLAALRAALPA